MPNFLPDAILPSYLVQFPNLIKDLPQKLISIEFNGGFSGNKDFFFLILASLLWDDQLEIFHDCMQRYLVLLLNWS